MSLASPPPSPSPSMPFKRPKKRPSLTAFFAPGGGGAIPKPSLATLGKRPSSSSSASAPSPSPKLGSARRVSSPQQAFDRSAHITAASSSLSSSRVEPAPRSAPAFAKNSVSAPSPPLADLLDDDPFAKLDSPLPPGFAPGSAASSSGLSLDDRDAGLDHDHDLDGASRKQHVVLTSCPTSARATVSVTPPSRIAASTPSLSTTPSSSSSLSSSSPSSSPLSSSSTATSPLAASSTASTSTSHSSPALSPVQPNRPIRPRLHRRPRTSNGLGVADLPHTQTLPASARPAVQKRPSLPSLKTLAEMQLTVVPRMPKGHVGAKLPLEPWARNVHRGDEVRIRSPTDSTFDGVYAYSGFDSAQLHAHLDKDQDKDQRPPPPERDLAMGPYRAWDMNSATSSFASSVSVSDYEIESIVEEEEEEGGETEHDNDDDNEGAYDGMSDRDEPASAPSSTPAPDAPLAPSYPPSLCADTSPSTSTSSCSDPPEAPLTPSLDSFPDMKNRSLPSAFPTSPPSTSPQPLPFPSLQAPAPVPTQADPASHTQPPSHTVRSSAIDTQHDELAHGLHTPAHEADANVNPDEHGDGRLLLLGSDTTTPPPPPPPPLDVPRARSISMPRGWLTKAWNKVRVSVKQGDVRSHAYGSGGGYGGGGWEHGYGGSGAEAMRAASGGFGNGNGGGRSSRGQGGGGGGMGGGSGSGSGSGGDGGDRRGASGSFLDTDSDTSESESGSDSEDEAGGRKKGGSTTSDDDVPLAQKIPTALKAQKTIRRQVRAEREERKRKKLLERAESQAQKAYLAHGPSMHRERNETLRPSANPRTSGSPPRQTSGASPHLPSMAGVVQQAVAADAARRMAALSLNNGPGDLSSSSSSSPPHIPRRTRAQTLTGGSSRPYAQPAPMPVPAMPVPVPQTPHRGASLQPRASTSRPGSPTRSGGWARAMRGLRQHSPNPPSVPPSPVIPSSPNPGHRRQPSVERERQREPSGLRPMRSFHRPSRSQNVTPPEGSPQMAQLQRSRSRAGRSSDERARRPSTSDGHHRPPVPPLPPQPPSRHSEQPPVPGRASVEHMPPAVLRQGPMVQQKIFVGDLQRFHTVELGPSTSAAEALETIQKTGALDGWVGSGSWLVFEVAQDFGMERPVREYEQLMDVIGSWNKEKSTNLLLVKKTPLASVLSRSALPTSSPTHGGYVEWESKRGKWNKRWLHLREHGLWLSKKDSSRDDQFLCSLSNFDVYAVTRQHKSPKPFVFAVKSTEPLSFFENTADYNHFFSCSDKDGPLWVQKILLARSYVLYQERNVLFSKSSSSGSTTGNQGGLARSGTRKRPAEPLVTVSAPFSATVAAASAAVFEPGSLLAKQ